ncbi:MOSC-domain-containing protein [Basidiobolus meristosporus CBS 931.73]|uniref:MOSC-domain-containing protein n=1 Tax=Basidiobolus meristosporus CBS 931.73 TaxID=1314790 RepID=A0A1Y1YDZ3_9FUNG|nr:MOSC-domain-containing protein [Basidiobolus meristosporus CBS 931.73]|eukprot:ORX96209.1 MOSC-domain-containing protein [Basidiobolus meristosporus CBS 931.73]
MTNCVVTGIHIYPVKSCKGISVDGATISRTGLLHDRFWMIIDEKDKFVTIREQPKLALVNVEIVLNSETSEKDHLKLSAPGMEHTVELPLQPEPEVYATPEIKTAVFKDTVFVHVASKEASQWVSDYLGVPVRVVVKSRVVRAVTEFMPPKEEFEYEPETAFADEYPINMVSEESLEDLNTRLEVPVQIRNFRPNIVIRGCASYEEDSWKRITIGEKEFFVVCPVARCQMPNTDFDKGERTSLQPLKTLMKYRRVFEKKPYHACFSVSLAPVKLGGEIRVGDVVKVLETK